MELRNDRVLIERLPEREGLIIKPDIANSKGIEGIVRAVGPGKYDEDGYRQPLDVKVGQRVLFNSKWSDFGPDFMNNDWRFDDKMHLIQEADIFAIL